MHHDDYHPVPTPIETSLHESIQSLSRSLTVVVACTQLLQRQSQAHEDVAPELINERIAMIEVAATDMVATLRYLQDVYSAARD